MQDRQKTDQIVELGKRSIRRLFARSCR